MFFSKKATVLIYVLILISIVMVMAVVILNNSATLQNTLDYQKIQSEISGKIRQKSDLLAKYDKSINSDGGGFVDNIACPNNITMSGNTQRTTGLVTSWMRVTNTLYICTGSYNGASINLFLNPTFNSFERAVWGFSTVGLVDVGGGNLAGTATFTTDNTLITMPANSYQRSDGVDDNFNSDNYNSKSIWSSQYNF